MKALRILIAIYILSLSVFPCSDKETCMDERKAGIALVDNSTHDHTGAEQDFCTPFCVCSCCAAHIQLNPVSPISFATFVHNTKVATLYVEKPLLDKTKAIWQPPKVS